MAYQLVIGLFALRVAVILLSAFPAALTYTLVTLTFFAGRGNEPIIESVMNLGTALSAVGAPLFILGVFGCTPPIPWVESIARARRIRRAVRSLALILIVCAIASPLYFGTLLAPWSTFHLFYSVAVVASVALLVALTPLWLRELARVATRRRKPRAWILAAVLAPACVFAGLFCVDQNFRTIGAIVFLVLAAASLLATSYATRCDRYFRRLQHSDRCPPRNDAIRSSDLDASTECLTERESP
ncbi:MAG: hypothetical protein AMXMBFR47_34890 [Planctomycetota bacterium]